MLLAGGLAHTDPAATTAVEVIEVRARSLLGQRWGEVGAFGRTDADTIALLAPDHAAEALGRAPGAWINRGSGQEHLTAIRSPVLTGPGSCGAFLVLEDGVPIRPVGFCNVNELFEVNFETADAIEVIRGPASGAFGGNALHGVINLVSPAPGAIRRLALDGGRDRYTTLGLHLGRSGRWPMRLDFFQGRSDGYRDREDYRQHKLRTVLQGRTGDWRYTARLHLNELRQETAGYLVCPDDYPGDCATLYRDDALVRTNPTPEAYRNASSQRALVHFERHLAGGGRLHLTPYARRSAMDFLQHFLPGQPREENGHRSRGLMFALTGDGHDWRGEFGVEAELADIFLNQFQARPLTDSSAFNNAVRPAGYHYDYRLQSSLLALRGTIEHRLGGGHLRLEFRAETLRYDYDNRLADGNARNDGTPCGFGGCHYSRPADRNDRFEDLGGRIAYRRSLGRALNLFASVSEAFRPPQATELYRLQRDQRVAELNTERLRALEIGVRSEAGSAQWELVVFAQRKRNHIFRDAENFNRSDGRTRHRGLELSVTGPLGQSHSLTFTGAWARHRYDFSSVAAGRETIIAGNRVDTAPDFMGSLRWRTAFGGKGTAELELQHLGRYFTDAANAHSYPGHNLLHWRGRWEFARSGRLRWRIHNLGDVNYAARADFSGFSGERFFPGLPRTLFVGVEFDLGSRGHNEPNKK